jgi:hypothetical protein
VSLLIGYKRCWSRSRLASLCLEDRTPASWMAGYLTQLPRYTLHTDSYPGLDSELSVYPLHSNITNTKHTSKISSSGDVPSVFPFRGAGITYFWRENVALEFIGARALSSVASWNSTLSSSSSYMATSWCWMVDWRYRIRSV